MAFDFPNVPFIGQQVTGAGGIVYQWDGTKWAAAVPSTAYAPIDSPTFTGDPKGPTPATGDNDTSLATTAFVKNVIAASPPPGAIISATAPTGQNPGAMWWDTNGGQLYILYNDGNSTQWVAANNIGLSNVATQADVGKNTGRNLIHNSMFNVQQRGAGPWTTQTYTADRWKLAPVSPDTDSTRVVGLADVDRAAIGDEAATWCLQNIFTGTTTGVTYVHQNIEGIRRLAGRQVVVSFWAVCASGTPRVAVNIAQIFGTGGSPSTAVWSGAAVVTISTTWTRYSVTLAVPSATGKTLGTNGDDYSQLTFFLNGGNNANAGGIGVQSGTIALWGVQLEIGSTATPLEKPDPQVDLANCQRFYQLMTATHRGYQLAGGVFGSSINFPVAMRASPTLVVAGSPGYTNASGFLVSPGSSNNYLTAWATATAAGVAEYQANITASADL